LVVLCLGLLIAHRDRIGEMLARAREPFVRPLEGDDAFEGASAALSDAPAPMQSRFAFSYLWLPAIGFVIGMMLCFSTAYFAIDAVLARFQVGWEQPFLGVVNLAAAFLALRVAAARLVTWPLALSAYRDATDRY
jgi:hypothetical protein